MAKNPQDRAVDAMREVLLATLGAVSLVAEESEKIFNDLVRRGSLTEQDLQRRVDEFRTRVRGSLDEARGRVNESLKELGDRVRTVARRGGAARRGKKK